LVISSAKKINYFLDLGIGKIFLRNNKIFLTSVIELVKALPYMRGGARAKPGFFLRNKLNEGP
jgi:hypothetical protein